MRHPLQRKITSVGRRARFSLAVWGIGWTLAAVLAAGVAVCLCDYFFRFEDRGVRAILSLAVLGVMAWAAKRFLYRALWTRWRDVQIALSVERRFPGFDDRLASTIEFLEQRDDDPLAGSAAMRQAVIRQATAQLDQLDLRDVIDRRPAVRAAVVAGGMVLIAGLLVARDPSSARVALARLIKPFGSGNWPQIHHLVFRDPPRRVALGEEFRVELVDARGVPLPDEVTIHYRYDPLDGNAAHESDRMRLLGERMVATRPSVSRPFQYRATGGDDISMRWFSLEVLEPPVIESVSVRLHYPDYTGWPSEPSTPHLRGLRGTRVEFSATTTKPLKAATLHQEHGRTVSAELLEDGYGFRIPADGAFVIDQTGSYWFVLEGEEVSNDGSQSRYEMRAIADLPPTVTIDEPSANIFVTPQAVVPLKVSAKDDLALRDMSLRFTRSDRAADEPIVQSLFAGPEQPVGRARDADGDDRRIVDYNWELASLGLAAGSQITFHAAAKDYQPLAGESEPRRLTIITSEELQDRLAERQSFILSELGRVLKLQQESRGQTHSLEIQLDQVGRFTQHDLDQLQGAELAQRQVERALTSRGEGVRAHVESFLTDLKNNKVDTPETQRRMESLAREIDRLESEELSVVARELTAAQKHAQARPLERASGKAGEGAQSDKPEDMSLATEALAEAGRHQDAVIESLEQMLAELSQWDNAKRYAREIGQLRRDQEQTAERTAELGKETLSKDRMDLSPQEQADLKKLAQVQHDLAHRFDKLHEGLEQMARELADGDPLSADMIADALEHARQQAIAGQMREAAENVDANRVGQAHGQQQQVAKDLDELLDILSDRRELEVSRLVKKLRQAEQELASMQTRQAGLRRQIEDAAANADAEAGRRELERLSREERRLENEVNRFARRLQRLQAEQASRTASRAGERLGAAGQQGEQGAGSAAAEEAQAAEEDLAQAAQQLAQRRRQAEMDLALQQFAKFEDSLRSLGDRQRGVIAETERLDQARQAAGTLSRGQAQSVRALAREQEALESETTDLAEKIKAAAVFDQALRKASRHMERATKLLDERDTGSTTQSAEQEAARRLAMLIESLKPEKPEPLAEEQAQQQGGATGAPAQGPSDGIPEVAQLKMLKLLQEDLNRRTRALDELVNHGSEMSAAQREEYAALGEEQGELADLLVNLSRPTQENPEDDPASLPEIPLENSDTGSDSSDNPIPAEADGQEPPEVEPQSE